MNESTESLVHLANSLDAPLKNSVKRLHKIIEEYKNRDFEYISYNDFKAIFHQLSIIHRQLLRSSIVSSRLIIQGKRSIRQRKIATDLNQLISDTVAVIANQVGSRIKFKLVLSRQPLTVAVGQIECFQIVNHLLMNAVESMPAGGQVTVMSRADLKHHKALVMIEDQGVGMSKEKLASLFEHHQDGLGLALVHTLIDVFSGTIHVHSSLRQGTRVSITLPIVS